MKIKETIKAHGFTLEQVANQMPNSRTGKYGITKQAMSLMINGNPTTETLRQIASIVGCDVADFFADERHSPDTFTCPKCGAKLKLVVEE